MPFDLPMFFAFIIAFAILAYVVMDGFDLGVGILFPFLPVGRERDSAINSVAPVWDGNETWLVMGGGGLLAAFPLAYGMILSALYAPIIAMLLALVFRGVAFEFRWRDPRHRPLWDVAFTGGSIVAALAQGITLGALLQGIAVQNRTYAGGWFDWLRRDGLRGLKPRPDESGAAHHDLDPGALLSKLQPGPYRGTDPVGCSHDVGIRPGSRHLASRGAVSGETGGQSPRIGGR